jgi:hypothetical protein
MLSTCIFEKLLSCLQAHKKRLFYKMLDLLTKLGVNEKKIIALCICCILVFFLIFCIKIGLKQSDHAVANVTGEAAGTENISSGSSDTGEEAEKKLRRTPPWIPLWSCFAILPQEAALNIWERYYFALDLTRRKKAAATVCTP